MNSSYRDSRLPIEQRVRDLLARMTLAEKVGQVMQPAGGWRAYRRDGAAARSALARMRFMPGCWRRRWCAGCRRTVARGGSSVR